MRKAILRLSFALCAVAVAACDARASSRVRANGLPSAPKQLSRSVADVNRLAAQAERNRYTVRRVEFEGNATIQHIVLARRFAFTEGDLFTVRALRETLRRLSRLRLIYPVRLRDVTVRLSREDEAIDLEFRIRERRRR